MPWFRDNVCTNPAFRGFNVVAAHRQGSGINCWIAAIASVTQARKKLTNPCGALMHAAKQFQAGKFV